MSIYPSSKVLPYVYQCIHKTTGKIYIGSRTPKNRKLPSHLDFPKYRTSSKIVKPIFEEFNWHIVAEFFNPKDAYNLEQELIHEQWQVSKEMSLNLVCHYDKEAFNTIGITKIHSKEHKRKIGDSLRGRSKSKNHKQNMTGIRRNQSKIIDVLTPDGFVIENTTMKELCLQFNLNYNTLKVYFRKQISYKGFVLIQDIS